MDSVDASADPSTKNTESISSVITVQPDNFYSPQNYAFYSQHPYEALNGTSRSIRLLKVSVDYYGEINCEFTKWIPLEEAQEKYTAISYCAGHPTKTTEIKVNGIPFNAFSSLAQSIIDTFIYREKHHQDQTPLLWVDQICINQSDATERSHQVGFMVDIYHSARDVAVCLSTEKSDSSAISSLKRLCWNPTLPHFPLLVSLFSTKTENAQLFVDHPHLEVFEQKHRDATISQLKDSRNRKQRHNRYIHNSEWFEIRQLICQNWWKRAWTFQEFVLAHDASFLYGGEAISWQILTVVLLSVFDAESQLQKRSDDDSFDLPLTGMHQSNGPEFDRSLAAVRFVLSYKAGLTKPGDLLKLLSHSRLCGSSDKRDQTYAFLGLTDPTYGILPDYGHKSIADVFTEAARCIMSFDKSIDVLFYAVSARGDLSPSLPSWVPDSTETSVTWRTTSDDLISPVSPYFFDLEPDARFFDDGKEAMPPIEGKVFALFAVSGSDSYYVARTSRAVQCGDEIWILPGCSFLVVLRRIQDLDADSTTSDDITSHTKKPENRSTDSLAMIKYEDSQAPSQSTDAPLRYMLICDTEIVHSVHQLIKTFTHEYTGCLARDEGRALSRI
ncbi:hypothetical protein CC86DRAFT_462091 [Ophiobolus disseminans]|uniref:Heterokaryon incompatibility domain-containing protein n=1 Tax=Ophiobolus disseminans TaxID=1469910 RepID=A0A6A7AKX3_9PLEO|nr:hypothetical protein CC86DRAFT_462091 [Ophiobolus disseminans]